MNPVTMSAVGKIEKKLGISTANLYNQTRLMAGYYVSGSDGVPAANANYSLTDYIPVFDNSTYYASNQFQLAWYDAGYKYIYGSTTTEFTTPGTYTSPPGAAYVRISVYTTYISTFDFRLVLSARNSENLFVLSAATQGYYVLYNNGSTSANAGYYASDWISVSPKKEYYISNRHQTAFYDNNKTYISGLSRSDYLPHVFRPPANAAYARFTIGNAYINTVMILENPYASSDILLPRNIYTLTGESGSTEQYNIYFNNIFVGGVDSVYLKCDYGRQYKDFWRLETPTYTTPVSAFGLQIWGGNKRQTMTKYKNILVEPVLKSSPTTAVRLLGIGDSITMDGTYLKQVVAKLANVSTVGTRTLDSGTTCTEGRGGWSIASYFNSPGTNSALDSPFVFPTTVAGTAYKGNVRDWKNICYDNPTAYDYTGFQKIGNGWSGSTPVYASSGYPSNPTNGDVVYDVSKGVGSYYQTWNGSAWVAMGTQPTAWEFSFTKYMQRFAAAYTGGAPTHVCIMLGANDFQKTLGVKGIDAFVTNLKTTINSIHSYNSAIRVIVLLNTLGAHQDAWGYNVACTGTADNYNYNMQVLTSRMLDEFDTDAAATERTYVCPVGAVVDPVYGFDQTLSENPNIYATGTTITRYNNWVHPNTTVGHRQMGDALAGIIQKFRA